MADPKPDDRAVELERKYIETTAALANWGRARLALTLALPILILGYLFSMYSKATAMYTAENFKPHVEEEVRKLTPGIREAVVDVARDVGPVYADLARDKMREALPQLRYRAWAEFEEFKVNMNGFAEKELQPAVDRAKDRLSNRLAEGFPTLASETGRERLKHTWFDAIDRDTQEVVLSFHTRYIQDVTEVQVALQAFDRTAYEDMSSEELTRLFVHLWLMRLDRHVLDMDSNEVRK